MHTFALIATLITPTGSESYLLDFNLSGHDCIEAMEIQATIADSGHFFLSCEFYYDDESAEGNF